MIPTSQTASPGASCDGCNMRWGICCVESLLMEPELQSTGAPERFWHRWFAWRPILITNRWRGRRLAWLQNVERRWTKGTTSGLGSRWIYRRMRAGGASDNAWSSRQANQNIAATTKTKTLNVKAPGLNIADPICEVGHNAPQARHRRTLFTSALQRVQISLAKTIPLWVAPSSRSYCWENLPMG